MQHFTFTRRMATTAAAVALTAAGWLGAAPAARAAAATPATPPTTAADPRVSVDVSVGTPVLLANTTQSTYIKVGLRGFPAPGADRMPLNVAIVLDRSGSMSGDRIAQAREAAVQAVELLDERDTVSVITYDSTVQVLVPATKLTARAKVIDAIRRIETGGNTALFAGVSRGADEVRRGKSDACASRVILLSDGQANEGPSSPAALAELGTSLLKEGIAVSTLGLGLGYNEDLMAGLARASDGNHAFVEKAADLAGIFKLEFGDLLSVVAQEVLVTVRFPEGVRPLRVLGREADLTGATVTCMLNALYGRQEKFLVVEVEVTGGAEGTTRPVADVEVSYGNMVTRRDDRLTASASVSFTKEEKVVAAKANTEVMVDAVQLVANAENKKAVDLRDAGKVAEAEALLRSNAAFLGRQAEIFKSEDLKQGAAMNDQQADEVKGKEWERSRKVMRREQHKLDMQQAY